MIMFLIFVCHVMRKGRTLLLWTMLLSRTGEVNKKVHEDKRTKKRILEPMLLLL